jgi:hypothetical protein
LRSRLLQARQFCTSRESSLLIGIREAGSTWLDCLTSLSACCLPIDWRFLIAEKPCKHRLLRGETLSRHFCNANSKKFPDRQSGLFPWQGSPAILVEPRAVAGHALCQFNQCESLGLWIPQSLAGCCSFGNHGSICDSRPIAISGHPRGTIVGVWP